MSPGLTCVVARSRMLVDLYHSGIKGHPRGPFLLTRPAAAKLPPHPDRALRDWLFWNSIPVNAFAKRPAEIKANIIASGFHIQDD